MFASFGPDLQLAMFFSHWVLFVEVARFRRPAVLYRIYRLLKNAFHRWALRAVWRGFTVAARVTDKADRIMMAHLQIYIARIVYIADHPYYVVEY